MSHKHQPGQHRSVWNCFAARLRFGSKASKQADRCLLLLLLLLRKNIKRTRTESKNYPALKKNQNKKIINEKMSGIGISMETGADPIGVSGGSSNIPGAWGAPTSDYNFCEVDYAVTYYLAEFFSAISSVPIALYGVYYLHQTALHGHGWKIALSSIGVIVIGVGSFAFHGTLQREGQMLDELPMLWSAVFFLFTALTLGEPPNSARSTWIGLGLMAYAGINSAVYFAGGFVYFILAYIVAVVCVFASTVHHMLKPEHREAHPLMRAFAYVAPRRLAIICLPTIVIC